MKDPYPMQSIFTQQQLEQLIDQSLTLQSNTLQLLNQLTAEQETVLQQRIAENQKKSKYDFGLLYQKFKDTYSQTDEIVKILAETNLKVRNKIGIIDRISSEVVKFYLDIQLGIKQPQVFEEESKQQAMQQTKLVKKTSVAQEEKKEVEIAQGFQGDYDIQFPEFQFADFQERFDKIKAGKLRLNISATASVYQVIVRILQQANSSLNELYQDLVAQGRLNSDLARKFSAQSQMIDSLDLCLANAIFAPQNDIFYQDQDAACWKRIKAHITNLDIENQQAYEASYHKVMNMFMAAQASFMRTADEQGQIGYGFEMTSKIAYYVIAKEEARHQAKLSLFQSKKNYKKLISFFNLSSANRAIKQMSKLKLDSIELNQVFYVPMLAKIFDMQESESYNNVTQATMEKLQPEYIKVTKRNIVFHIDERKYNPDKEVQIRLLCPFKLKVDFKTNDVDQSKYYVPNCDKIIIHFHGGGFICQATSDHEIYLRKWANELKVPVFSVDYRLAPRNPYPDPINDCYQAYVWIITQAKQQLGMDIKHVILAGDSAGGNLVISVTLLAILRGFRKPDALVPIYPVLSMVNDHFYPSSLITLDCDLLHTAFVQAMRGCYLRKGGEQSIICSPINAPDCLLKKIPPVVMFVCQIDSLRDQEFHFADRLLNAVDDEPNRLQIFYLLDYIHGSQSIRFLGIDEYERGNAACIQEINRLFQSFN